MCMCMCMHIGFVLRCMYVPANKLQSSAIREWTYPSPSLILMLSKHEKELLPNYFQCLAWLVRPGHNYNIILLILSTCLQSNERNVLSQAILSAVRDHCNANCDDLTFGTPQLTCSVDNTRGNFTTEVTAFEAQAVVTDFYRATQDPVLIEKDDVTFMIQCSTCTDPPEPTEDESNFMRYIIIGLVGVIAALILLVLVLILAVVKKK